MTRHGAARWLLHAGPRPRRQAAALLLLVVAIMHAWLGSWVADSAFDLGAGAAAKGPPRLKAMFVADLRPSTPPALAPQVVPPASRRPTAAPRPASAAASATQPAIVPLPDPPRPPATAPAEARQDETVVLDESAEAASAPAAAASQAAVPATSAAVAAAASAALPFEWPRSTRLSYRLTGDYRGPVEGQASVEWLRDGSRYQVHLEVSVGPLFAPLVSRRMSSDGEIGSQGLSPRRYDEETKVALRDPRRLALLFDGPVLRLANGSEQPRPDGVQDAASQFVQLTWLFTTQPERLRAGQSVELMLALPRRVDLWIYDVLGSEPLVTPAGVIDAVHVRPRRPARSGELTAEMWIAPTLQYLPVRIVIRQDADNFVDLMLDRLPQQAAEGGAR